MSPGSSNLETRIRDFASTEEAVLLLHDLGNFVSISLSPN
jgi:hypothetical protein